MTIFELYENVRNISIEGITYDIVVSSDDRIVEIQKDQMTSGKDSTGEGIAPSYYSDAYAEMKQKMNRRPEFGTPDLRLTGAFYDGFYLDFNKLVVSSTDEKADLLKKKYGNWIFGLSEESVSRYLEYFNPKFMEEFLAQLSDE